MSKQLTNLLEKACKNEKASVNGRIIEHDFGYTFVGDLQEKWYMEFFNNDDDDLSFTLRHWGTEILRLQFEPKFDAWYIVKDNLYAQSKTDVYAINFILDKFGIGLTAHYYPSKEKSTIVDDKYNSVIFEF